MLDLPSDFLQPPKKLRRHSHMFPSQIPPQHCTTGRGDCVCVEAALAPQGGKTSLEIARNATAIAKLHYVDRDNRSEEEIKLSWKQGSVE